MKIDLSKKLHQDNLKSEVYHQFKKRFEFSAFDLICEYKTTGSRFDILVYDKESLDALVIIEIRRIGAKKPPDEGGKQFTKYSKFGHNLLYISEFVEIPNLLNSIERIYLKYKESHKCITTDYPI